MDSTFLSVSAVIVLLAINAFFVAAEFALVKARGFRIETLADDGQAAARMTLRIQRNLEAYLAACQLGITMASLGLGWVGEPAVAALFEPLFRMFALSETTLHTLAFIVGFLIFSSLHIVIGEQVPKTFAIRKPDPVSLLVAYPLRVFFLFAFPLNWLLNRSSQMILSWFRVEEATHGEVFSDNELKGMVATSKQHGELEEGKATMLRNLFEFDQRQVSRVMIPRSDVQVLDLNEEMESNKRIILDSGHSRFPVVQGGLENIVGIVLAKDLYTAILTGATEPWKALGQFARKPLVIPETQRISKVFDTMRIHRAHMALVVDEYGELSGIITLEDLLEEIVGEIEDETDSVKKAHPIENRVDYWQAHGLATLTDIARAVGLSVPDELDANTLSGLFMQRLGRMPKVGDSIAENGFEVEVKGLEGSRVGLVHIIKHEPQQGADVASTGNPVKSKDDSNSV